MVEPVGRPDGRTADRIPTDYQATDEVTSRLLRELDCPDEEALYDRQGRII